MRRLLILALLTPTVAMAADFTGATMEDVHVWLAILLGLFCLLGVWSAFSGHVTPVRGPQAKGLYLTVPYRLENGRVAADNEQRAHLISLTLYDATLVFTRFLDKGEKLVLDFASLPSFPSQQPVKVEVVSSRLLSSHPVSCLVKVKFADLGEAAKEPLTRYVENLARRKQGALT